MSEPNVVVVGSVNMDLSVRVPHLPRAGETVSGGDLEHGAGGKGANQAVAARLLGASTTMVARVGSDEFGSQARRALDAAGVDTSAVATVATATGTALIVIGPDGDNIITVSPGANGQLGPDCLDGLAERLARADALLLQLEVPVATCTAAARLARAAGVQVVLNAAPLPHVIGDDLRGLIAEADVLIVNEVEAAGLLDAAPSGPAGPDPHAYPAALRSLGPSDVVVTLGARGAVYAGSDGHSEHVPAFPVDAIDAVGAGDTFCAALTVARATGVPDLGEAVRRACAAGALAAASRGGLASFPNRTEVDEFLKQRSDHAS
ncbi:ribokinase [Streptomyces sp. NPDC060000]|uniref:ribokinase n=1 Tax=Streptomyces sp. NPDC060000 TaxID=3347031 RepID=UPI0036976A2E